MIKPYRSAIMGWQTVAVLQFLSINSHIFCGAQLLSAYEQVYGPWNIKLTKNIFGRRRWHLETPDSENTADGDYDSANDVRRRKRGRRKKEESDLQLLFPQARRPPLPDKLSDEEGKYTADGGESETRTTKSIGSVPCILNLETNGKFTLSLAKDDEYNRKGALDDGHCNPPSDIATPTTNHPSPPIHHALKGEWYLTPNPYCITDRGFDTLLLVSEPRMRRNRSAVVEKATVEFRCKVWGRYGAGAVREKIGVKHGRVRGRMTHGTIMIVKEQVDAGGGTKMVPTREVVGTFRGKTIIRDSAGRNVRLSDEEEPIDGHDDDGYDDLNLNVEDDFDEFGAL